MKSLLIAAVCLSILSPYAFADKRNGRIVVHCSGTIIDNARASDLEISQGGKDATVCLLPRKLPGGVDTKKEILTKYAQYFGSELGGRFVGNVDDVVWDNIEGQWLFIIDSIAGPENEDHR